MESTIIVIIASNKLCKDFSHLGQMKFENDRVEHVNLYACGADNKEAVLPFINTLMDKYEYTEAHKDNVKRFLSFIPSVMATQIEEKLKLSIIWQMPQIKSDSWKYANELMNDDKYLVLLPEVSSLDISDTNVILQMLASPPFRQ